MWFDLNDPALGAETPVGHAEPQPGPAEAIQACGEVTYAHARRCVHPHTLLRHLDTRPCRRGDDHYVLLEVAAAVPAVADACFGKTVHLCEAPGHFVEAALEISDGVTDWHATSLRTRSAPPFHNALLRAKKPNGHSRVIFGADGTGNLLEKGNAGTVIHECGAGSAGMVTADGHGSERLAAAELAVAMQVLAPGGCVVLRLPDGDASGVIGAVIRLFDAAHLVALRCIDPCSGARHLVATGFRGVDAEVLAACEETAFGKAGGVRLSTPLPPQIAVAESRVAAARAEATARAVALAYYLRAIKVHTAADVQQHHANVVARCPNKVRTATDYLTEVSPAP